MKKTPTQPVKKKCKNCNKAISPGRNRLRVYCNAACKQAAWRKRKEGSVTVSLQR